MVKGIVKPKKYGDYVKCLFLYEREIIRLETLFAKEDIKIM